MSKSVKILHLKQIYIRRSSGFWSVRRVFRQRSKVTKQQVKETAVSGLFQPILCGLNVRTRKKTWKYCVLAPLLIAFIPFKLNCNTYSAAWFCYFWTCHQSRLLLRMLNNRRWFLNYLCVVVIVEVTQRSRFDFFSLSLLKKAIPCERRSRIYCVSFEGTSRNKLN